MCFEAVALSVDARPRQRGERDTSLCRHCPGFLSTATSDDPRYLQRWQPSLAHPWHFESQAQAPNTPPFVKWPPCTSRRALENNLSSIPAWHVCIQMITPRSHFLVITQERPPSLDAARCVTQPLQPAFKHTGGSGLAPCGSEQSSGDGVS